MAMSQFLISVACRVTQMTASSLFVICLKLRFNSLVLNHKRKGNTNLEEHFPSQQFRDPGIFANITHFHMSVHVASIVNSWLFTVFMLLCP